MTNYDTWVGITSKDKSIHSHSLNNDSVWLIKLGFPAKTSQFINTDSLIVLQAKLNMDYNKFHSPIAFHHFGYFVAMNFCILSFLLVTAGAICQNSTNQDNFSYLPKLRLLRNHCVARNQIFCLQNGEDDHHFALYRGRLRHLASVIGVYRKKGQSHICYFRNESSLDLVDVNTMTGGELYTIGMWHL